MPPESAVVPGAAAASFVALPPASAGAGELGELDELDEHAAERVKSTDDPRLRRIRWLRMAYKLRSAPIRGHVPIG